MSGLIRGHKRKGVFSGSGVRRSSGGSWPHDRRPRLISDEFRPFLRCTGILEQILSVPLIDVPSLLS